MKLIRKQSQETEERRWHRKLSKEICHPRMRRGKVGMADGFVRVNLQK